MRFHAPLLSACLALVGSDGAVAADARASEPLRVRYGQLAFVLPASDWVRSVAGNTLELQRNPHALRRQVLSVWRVDVPKGYATFSVQQHTTAFFDTLRKFQHPSSEHWQAFVEKTQIAGPREYAAMSFHVTFDDPGVTQSVDGLYVVFFPADFAEDQYFYCFMWKDAHTAGDIPTAADLEPLISALGTNSPPPLPLIDAALERLMTLGPAAPGETQVSPEEGRTAVTKGVQEGKSAVRYSSLAHFSFSGKENGAIVWRVDAASGDRFHVIQSSGRLSDEWISIGKDDFRNAGVWTRHGAPTDAALNRFFSADKFLHLMAASTPISAGEVAAGPYRFLVLEYRVKLGSDFAPVFPSTVTDAAQVRVWIERQTNTLMKGEVKAQDGTTGAQLHLEQTYNGQQIHTRIEPPRVPR